MENKEVEPVFNEYCASVVYSLKVSKHFATKRLKNLTEYLVILAYKIMHEDLI